MPQAEEKLGQAISRHPWLGLPLSLFAAVLALLLFAWVADSVLDQKTQSFDLQIRAAVHQHASPQLTVAMRAITWLGSWQVLLPTVCCLLAIFILRGMSREGRLLLLTIVGAEVLDTVLKLSFRRVRPAPFFGIPPLDTYSFPSGHALVSFCFYGLIAGLITTRARRKWLRAIIWLVAFVIVGLIGFSRIYLGVHYPSDVIAGYIAAIFWMGALKAVAQRRERARA
jgi:undecaprenyl-diphosphatase